jgi:hypothetical protein
MASRLRRPDLDHGRYEAQPFKFSLNITADNHDRPAKTLGEKQLVHQHCQILYYPDSGCQHSFNYIWDHSVAAIFAMVQPHWGA